MLQNFSLSSKSMNTSKDMFFKNFSSKKLTRLDLSSFDLDDKLAQMLAKEIRGGQFPKLRTLIINSKSITETGVNSILDALATNKCPQLFSIDISGKNVPQDIVFEFLPKLSKTCIGLTWVNGINIKTQTQILLQALKYINKINQILKYGILNGKNAAKKGLIISTSSDKIEVNPEDYSEKIYAYSTYKDVPIVRACLGSLSVAMEKAEDGILAKKQLFSNTQDKSCVVLFDTKKALELAQLKSYIKKVCWKINPDKIKELEMRAHQTVLFVTSSKKIQQCGGLVTNKGDSVPKPQELLEISQNIHNEIPQLGLNIMPEAIEMVLIPELLRPFRKLINFPNVVFVKSEAQLINFSFNLTPNDKSPDFVKIEKVKIPAPKYNCFELEKFTKEHNYTITHIARL